MTSQKSFSNFKMFLETIKQQKYIMILHTLVLFLATTLPTFVYYSDAVSTKRTMNENFYNSLVNLLSGNENIMVFIVTIVGAISAVVVFSYMFKHQSVQFYHSMPITRTNLYISRFLGGVVSILIPLLTVFIVNSIVFALIGLSNYNLMLLSLLKHIITYICIFSVASFCSVLSCNYFATALLVAYVFLVYFVSTGIISLHIQKCLSWVSLSFKYNITYLFPPAALTEEVFPYLFIIIYTLIFAILGAVIYKFRKSENSDKFYAFSRLTLFLKYYLTFFASLTFGFVISSSTKNNIISFLGYILGGFIAYIILQALFNKSFKGMFSHMKGFIALMVVICLVVSIPMFGENFDKAFTVNPNYTKELRLSHSMFGFNEMYILTDKDSIKEASDLIKKDVGYKNGHNDFVNVRLNPNNPFFYISYSSLINYDDMLQFEEKIYDNSDYKDNLIKEITRVVNENRNIYVMKHETHPLTLDIGGSVKENGEKLLETLSTDIKNSTYKEIKDSYVYATIEFDVTQVKVYKCFENTVKFINENCRYAFIGNYEDIKKLTVSTYNSDGKTNSYNTDNADVINEILEHSAGYGADIVTIDKNGNERRFATSLNSLPHYVKEALEK